MKIIRARIIIHPVPIKKIILRIVTLSLIILIARYFECIESRAVGMQLDNSNNFSIKLKTQSESAIVIFVLSKRILHEESI